MSLRNEDNDDDDRHFPLVFIKNYIDMFSNSVEWTLLILYCAVTAALVYSKQ